MAIDSMNKVIHAAVRRDLGRLEAALREVDGTRQDRARDLHRAWAHLHDQLHHHHRQEEGIIFPAVVGLGVDQNLLEELESEHGAMIAALEDIDAAMATYTASGAATDAAVAADVVRRGSVVVEEHLAHEEGELEPMLQPHLESPEWRAVERQIRKQPPTKVGWFFAWLQDGGSQEAQAFLARTIPGPVRFVFSRIFGRGYHATIAPVWR
ncbi:MAG TPA: hemerythrin domain-containing protein [Nocardioides sp.]|nr:hemerythrin domain-containing protein [Nocardioides sp.]